MTTRCPRCGSTRLRWPSFSKGLGCSCHRAGWVHVCEDCRYRWFTHGPDGQFAATRGGSR